MPAVGSRNDGPAPPQQAATTAQQQDIGGAVPPHTVGSGEGQRGQQRMISALDIQLVQNLVERCLQLYMNQREVVSILQQQAKIEPGFTGLVWQKLEEQNPDFFTAYYARLRLKDQIVVFNQLVERHYHMLRGNPPNTLHFGQQPQNEQPLQNPGVLPLQHLQNAGSQLASLQHSPPQQPLPQHHIYNRQQGGATVWQNQQLQRIMQPGQQQQPYVGVGDLSLCVEGTLPAVEVHDTYGALGRAREMVQPLRSAAHGEGVFAKENNFNEFNTSSGLSVLSTTLPHRKFSSSHHLNTNDPCIVSLFSTAANPATEL